MRLKLTSPFTKRNLISQDCIPDQIPMTKVKYNLSPSWLFDTRLVNLHL